MTQDTKITINGPWTSQGWVPTWAYIPIHDCEGNVVASFYPKAYRVSNADTEARARLAAAAPKLLKALTKACYIMQEDEAYFDNRADADCDQDGFVPNDEMRRLSEVRAALQEAERAIKSATES